MSNQEFSNQFDTLLDSFKLREAFSTTSNIATIKLDEYEKSVLLTDAQKALVIELYSGRNFTGTPYEQTQELRSYIQNLNVTKDIVPGAAGTAISNNPHWFELPDDYMFTTIERAKISSTDVCIDGKWFDVKPAKRDEFLEKEKNPFFRKYVLRLDHDDKVELVHKETVTTYKLGYLKRPKPIVLEDLGDLSIEGETTETECELNPILHQFILEMAVQRAYTYIASKVNTDS